MGLIGELMSKLRPYNDMAEMLEKEASSNYDDINHAVVSHGEKDHPDYQYIVLLIEPRVTSSNYHILVYVPSLTFGTLEEAEIAESASDHHPVAYWIRSDPAAR